MGRDVRIGGRVTSVPANGFTVEMEDVQPLW